MMTEAILADAVPARDKKATPRERRRFTEAMVLSALGHGLAILAVIVLWHPEPVPVPLPPIPVKVIETIGATGAAGAGHDVAAPEASTGSATDAAAPAVPSTATASAQPAPQTPSTTAPPAPATPPPPAPPVEAASAPPPPAPTPKAIPLPAPQVATASLEPVPPEKPTPPQPPAPTPIEIAATPLKAPTAPPQAQPSPASSPSTKAAAPSAAPANIASTGTGGQGRNDQGAGRVEAGNGKLDGPSDDYLEKVRRWVARFRVYPDEAIKKREEGVVSIGFKFARDGTVLNAWIEKSSGFPMLDQAALKMIHNASPIPKVPEKYKGDTLTLTMPENYHIGLFDRLFN